MSTVEGTSLQKRQSTLAPEELESTCINLLWRLPVWSRSDLSESFGPPRHQLGDLAWWNLIRPPRLGPSLGSVHPMTGVFSSKRGFRLHIAEGKRQKATEQCGGRFRLSSYRTVGVWEGP